MEKLGGGSGILPEMVKSQGRISSIDIGLRPYSVEREKGAQGVC